MFSSIKTREVARHRRIALLPLSRFITNRASLSILCAVIFCALSFSSTTVSAQTTTPPPAPPTTTPRVPPAGTSTQTGTQQQTNTPQPSATPLPPNAPGSTIRPDNETQQSVQPQTGPQQERQQTTPNTQGPRPVTPQNPGDTTPSTGLPTTATPAGTTAPTTTTNGANPATGTTTNGVPATPGSNVGVSTSGVAPAQLPTEPPPISPNYQAPPRPLPSAERVGVDVTDQLPLSLNDAIRMALKNSNDIDESRIDVQIAEFNLNAARGVYDPLASSESYYERRTTPTSSTLGGSTNGSVTQTDATGAVSLGGFSPYGGGAYELDFSSTRLTTNNQNVTLNPQFPSALTLTYTQPLFRGFRFDNNRRQIEIAKKNLTLSDAQFRQRAIDTISLVEQAYWDLAFSLRNLQVQIDAVKQARIQVESNQRLVEKGVLAPIDIVAAQTQVTTFEQSIYTAQESVTQAENTLKTLILPDRTEATWARAITPVTPVSLEAPRVPLEQAIKSALDNRQDLAQLRTTAEVNGINVRYFRDQTKPQLDLVGTYTTAGLAGTLVTPGASSSRGTSPALLARVNELSALANLAPLPPTVATTSTVSPNLVGGYGQSLQNLLDQSYPTARVGVRISLPLRNRTAEANLGGALALGNRITDQLRQAEQLIEADVRNSMQAVRSAEARLASAAASRSSAEQQFASEQRQFRAGTTTVYLVLQRQTDLLATRGRELQAQTDLNKAIAQFQRATGNTLEVNNVAIRTDSPMRELEQRPTPSTEIQTDAAGIAPANNTNSLTGSKLSLTQP